MTENRNRLFQIRAPTYSPTHPPTIRATSSFTKAKLEPTYPPLCKSTRLAVTHASPRFSRRYFSSFSPPSTLSLSFEIVRQTTKDRSNERNNPLEEGSGGGRRCERQEGNVESRNVRLKSIRLKNIWTEEFWFCARRAIIGTKGFVQSNLYGKNRQVRHDRSISLREIRIMEEYIESENG